jgi:hypothetical protein
MARGRARIAAAALLLTAAGLSQVSWRRPPDQAPSFPEKAEFFFIRLEYTDLFRSGRGFGRAPGRGWWMQDWPAAEIHFAQGVRRLTRIDVGEGLHFPLTDDRIFGYPWLYATQVGYWDLSGVEMERLREYLLRGGFLVVDDFWGPAEWDVFRAAIERVFPGQPIVDIPEGDPMMHVLYDITERTLIPGLRHLRIGPGGAIVAVPEASPPHWRAMYDDRGRMLVAIHHNMDIGDAWEHADSPEYPEAATGLAYRLAINSIIYSMTH